MRKQELNKFNLWGERTEEEVNRLLHSAVKNPLIMIRCFQFKDETNMPRETAVDIPYFLRLTGNQVGLANLHYHMSNADIIRLEKLERTDARGSQETEGERIIAIKNPSPEEALQIVIYAAKKPNRWISYTKKGQGRTIVLEVVNPHRQLGTPVNNPRTTMLTELAGKLQDTEVYIHDFSKE
ncbi:MAG: hypothetical protein HYZ02_03110 [Candidatus Levybacteria bacterium]|nr:hypothetical protein [Candidatus Levybacteria bacterium]MBI3093197.1 hypothetical protein [Candidatus Levybacteria bacterium]